MAHEVFKLRDESSSMGSLFPNYPLLLMCNCGQVFLQRTKINTYFNKERIQHQVIFEYHVGGTRIVRHSSQIFFVTFIHTLSTEPK